MSCARTNADSDDVHAPVSPQVFRSTLAFLGESLVPQVEARYPRALMDFRRARAMARAAQPPRAHLPTIVILITAPDGRSLTRQAHAGLA